nr:RNA-directed DNA polymerase, eukaryota, reverse transcriptase zinc-binding domain protein [Tanacetum cinerariifolium]
MSNQQGPPARPWFRLATMRPPPPPSPPAPVAPTPPTNQGALLRRPTFIRPTFTQNAPLPQLAPAPQTQRSVPTPPPQQATPTPPPQQPSPTPSPPRPALAPQTQQSIPTPPPQQANPTPPPQQPTPTPQPRQPSPMPSAQTQQSIPTPPPKQVTPTPPPQQPTPTPQPRQPSPSSSPPRPIKTPQPISPVPATNVTMPPPSPLHESPQFSPPTTPPPQKLAPPLEVLNSPPPPPQSKSLEPSSTTTTTINRAISPPSSPPKSPFPLPSTNVATPQKSPSPPPPSPPKISPLVPSPPSSPPRPSTMQLYENPLAPPSPPKITQLPQKNSPPSVTINPLYREHNSKTMHVQEIKENPKNSANTFNGRHIGGIHTHHSTRKPETHKRHLATEDHVGKSVITIAGDNKGAIMNLTPFRDQKHEHGHNPATSKNGDTSKTDSETENIKQNSDTLLRTSFLNSNVQGVNNSILYNSDIDHHDPGIHLTLSTKSEGFLSNGNECSETYFFTCKNSDVFLSENLRCQIHDDDLFSFLSNCCGKPSKLSNVASMVFGGWDWVSNSVYSTNGCRIMIGWDKNKVDVDLRRFKAITSGSPWILMGDFNVTLNLEEHSAGGSRINRDMQEFREYVHDIEVDDINCTGLFYTWIKSPSKPKTSILKKLDRAMVNFDFIDIYGSAYARFHLFLISDHSPVVVHLPNTLEKKKKNVRKLEEELRRAQVDVEANPSCKVIDNPDTLFLNKLSKIEAEYMVEEITNKEIKEAMFGIGNEKSPNPDGFTTMFFKKSWDIMGMDVCGAVKEFFNSNKLLGEINATLITFVLKIQQPNKVSDYRPIACCNVIYKCISNIITKRLQGCLEKLVSINQSAFVPGRLIQDNLLITQELLKGQIATHNIYLSFHANLLGFVFLIPKRSVKDIEKVLKGFLWCHGDLKKGAAKVAWKVICAPKSQVKLKNKSIWEVNIDESDSGTWKAILNLSNVIRDSIWKEIDDGRTTNVWFDKWSNEGPLYIQTPTLREKEQDCLIWKDQNRNEMKFFVKSVWEKFKERKLEISWHKVVCYSQCNPRHAFIVWLAMHKRLATQDRIMAWNKNADLNYPLCPYSEEIWRNVTTKMGKRNWDNV